MTEFNPVLIIVGFRTKAWIEFNPILRVGYRIKEGIKCNPILRIKYRIKSGIKFKYISRVGYRNKAWRLNLILFSGLDVGLKEGDPGWLGAWWLGFIIVSGLTIFIAPFLGRLTS